MDRICNILKITQNRSQPERFVSLVFPCDMTILYASAMAQVQAFFLHNFEFWFVIQITLTFKLINHLKLSNSNVLGINVVLQLLL